MAENDEYMADIYSYEKLHLLKPKIGFVLYIKDFTQYMNILENNKK